MAEDNERNLGDQKMIEN